MDKEKLFDMYKVTWVCGVYHDPLGYAYFSKKEDAYNYAFSAKKKDLVDGVYIHHRDRMLYSSTWDVIAQKWRRNKDYESKDYDE